MTTTPEQIEAVARMRLMIQSAVEDDARAWELTDTELAVIAEAAISAMRPFIRAEALEEAAREAECTPHQFKFIGAPPGSVEMVNSHKSIAAAIRALKDT